MRALVLASLALTVGAGSAAAQQKSTWLVTESGLATSQGQWQMTVTGSTVSGQGTMTTASGRQVSFGIAGERRGDEMLLKRTGSSDGQPCAYRGRIETDGRIVGTVLCGNSNSRWMVVRR